MFKKSPKDPLARDLNSAIMWIFMAIAAIVVRNFILAVVFILFSVYYFWHRKKTKEKIMDALEKREQNFADIYGYEESYGDDVSFEDDED